MGVARGHSRPRVLGHGLGPARDHEGVRGGLPAQVPALDQHARAEGLRHGPALLERLVPRGGHGPLREHGELGQVGGDQVRVVQDAAQRVLGVGLEQPSPGGGHHDGVDHGHGRTVGREPRPHRLDDVHRAEHPDLHGIQLHVLRHGVQLRLQHGHGWGVDRHHALRVLRDHRSDHAQPEAAHGGDGLQVRGVPGTTRGVGAGDREDAGGGDRRRGVHDIPFASTS